MPKKGENIYKRKDGRWEGRYIKSRTESGKIIYGYVYARSYRETKEKQKAKMVSCNSQTINKNEHTFSWLASEWFESIKLHTKASTQNKYHNMLTNYILPEYGNQPFNAITYDFIESHCKFLLEAGGKKGNGLSPKTVSDVLAIIRNISKFAIRKGIYVACDASAVQIRQDVKPMRVFSIVEQNQLCNHILENPEPCNIGILVCLFTGLRVGEICALRWEDISYSDQSIYIHHTLQRIQINGKILSIRVKRNVPIERFSLHSRTHPVFMALAHDIDIITWLTNSRIKSVCGIQKKSKEEYRSPDIVFGIAEMENGVVCNLETQWRLPNEFGQYLDTELTVMTEKGQLKLNCPGNTLVSMFDGKLESHDMTLWPEINGEITGALVNENKHMIDLVLGRTKKPIVTVEQAVRGIEFCQYLIESCNTGKIVERGCMTK